MTSKKPLLIVLVGPTAAGKTELGIKIAKKLNINIHNIDSRQMYQEFNIGTAKPTLIEQNEVKHFLLDICKPNQPISIKEFQLIAYRSIYQEINKGTLPFLVGGSGLYVKSIIDGFTPPPVAPQKKLRDQLQQLNPEERYELLNICDPISYERINKSDVIRTIRALEIYYATGNPISYYNKNEAPKWEILEIGLDRKNLKERILTRTHFIFKNGLIEETENIIQKYGQRLSLLKTIGYKQAVDLIENRLKLEDAILETTQKTIQFAKRQRTWFRNKHKPIWLKSTDLEEEALSLIKNALS
tara:strand:- start:6611 stop:7510 length:900 start_codon:yes stop_codon:yes gene_type:complete